MPSKFTSLIGELMLTIGALILLYVGYSIWFTNLAAELTTKTATESFLDQVQQRMEQLQATSESGLENVTSPLLGQGDSAVSAPFVPVEPFALLYIPRLKSDVWAEPLVEGIYYRALASGVGHYPSTELPGQVGNFAIAGHRATNGEPFARFERLEVGDRVFVQSLDGWFEYELLKDKIVQEDETWVLSNNPDGQGFKPGDKLITLTTCDPRWNSFQRWVWWGKLVASYPLDEAPIEMGS